MTRRDGLTEDEAMRYPRVAAFYAKHGISLNEHAVGNVRVWLLESMEADEDLESLAEEFDDCDCEECNPALAS